jgi:hypothetical protein
MRKLLLVAMLAFGMSWASAQIAPPADSDHDGLSDALESALLAQFEPHFLISAGDCSSRPAAFVPLQSKPVVELENGTIYGQAFPRAGNRDQVELHFYHLWRIDCGDRGHNLDAEHVSALVSRDGDSNWRALYWYAAAHEDTVCDASQITRASTVDAVDRGPQVWISRGKHASFMSQVLCSHGCGGDECRDLQSLAVAAIINLGEPEAPVSGATWVNVPQWPLAAKMRRSDFEVTRLARVDQLSAATILWANPQKHPYQGIIRNSRNTANGVATGARATDAALDLADEKTGNALAGASTSTGNGLSKTYRGVKDALRITAQKVGKALGAK